MPESKKIKILLVDDDKFLLDMYALKFKKADIEVDAVSNSSSVIEKIKENSYDIIVLDIIMPGVDGMEILKKIKEDKISPNSKIIMLTNQADEVDKAKALGVDGYIIKATTIPSEVVEKVLAIYKG